MDCLSSTWIMGKKGLFEPEILTHNPCRWVASAWIGDKQELCD